MDFLLIGTLAWLGIGISGTIYLRRKSSWFTFFGGCTLALYGAIPGIGLSMDGRTLNNPTMELAGQFLLFFFSVLGVALVSAAWAELRSTSRAQEAHDS